MDKVALVTGAGSGIGRAVAGRARQSGLLRGAGGAAGGRFAETAALAPDATMVPVPTDIADAGAVAALFAAVKARFGRLDLLFNNAGTGAPPVAMEELTPAQWQAVVDVNLTGPFLCTQQALRLMKEQVPRGGRIVNNGSISAHAPRPNSAPYTATKHAITGLTKATALDGRAFDIACGQIDIGNAETPMTARISKGRAAAGRDCEGGGDDGCGGGGEGGALHGEPAAGRQCAEPDGDGDEDAVRRAGGRTDFASKQSCHPGRPRRKPGESRDPSGRCAMGPGSRSPTLAWPG